MKRLLQGLTMGTLLMLWAATASAHFQVLLPSSDIVEPGDTTTLGFSILFTHPMENGPIMEMAGVKRFGVLHHQVTEDLTHTLQAVKHNGRTGFAASFRISRPGDHIFFLEPKPYFEPAEEKMIIHYTKVVVDGLGAEDGWDRPAGLPVEIIPLTRPYGLWTGNLFTGRVVHHGTPVPHALVEVEYLNRDGLMAIPKGAYSTQVIRADEDGVFSYAMPRGGWWGFAALVDGDEPLPSPEGREVDVELGGLIWVFTRDMAEKR